MIAEALLKSAYPVELVEALLSAYKEIESNFAAKRWKASELDAGHLVEAARRVIDFSLTGKYAHIGKSLPSFNDAELKRYEQLAGDESYRLLIPRVLKSIYNIRNKRGVGHLGAVSPNEMDATLILYSSKWVLGELVRLASGATSDPTDAQRAVDRIMERRLDLLWKSGDVVRVLHSDLPARDQVLILLYDQNLQSETALQASIEYKSTSKFRLIIKQLHAARLVEFSPGFPIAITPKGVEAAERLIVDLSSANEPTVKRSGKKRRK